MNKASTIRNKPSSHASSDFSMTKVSSEQWDSTISSFTDLRQEQLAVFINNRWPKLDTQYCIFESKEGSSKQKVIAGAAVMVARIPVIGSGVAIIKWGPMLKDVAEFEQSEKQYQACIDLLIKYFAVEQNLLLSILPSTFADPRDWQETVLTNNGFSKGKGLSFPDRYYVDLALDADSQRKSYGSKWRYHLKKSEKEDLSFIHAPAFENSNKNEHFQIFMQLYQLMSDRKQFPDHSAVDTLPTLMSIKDKNLRPELFLVKKDNETVAGAIIFKAGDATVYLYGATSDAALPLRAGYFMHDRIIQWLSSNTDARWYDLGGNDGFSGLHQFKKGMVGKSGSITQVPVLYTYGHTLKSRLIGAALFKLKDIKASVQQRIESWRGKLASGDLP